MLRTCPSKAKPKSGRLLHDEEESLPLRRVKEFGERDGTPLHRAAGLSLQCSDNLDGVSYRVEDAGCGMPMSQSQCSAAGLGLGLGSWSWFLVLGSKDVKMLISNFNSV